MNIGFDLDKIFINFPPFVPSKIIDFFYKERNNNGLRYKIPSRLEQIVRIFSHYPLFRSPNVKNMRYMKSLALANKNKYYLISSRFDFLKNRTDKIIERFSLNKIFDAMYFNYSNNQPHEFKDKMVKKLNLDIFVDDDLDLLEYLIDKNPKTRFFWLNEKTSKPLKKNLFAIKNISEIFTPHQNWCGV
jgi:predicted phosphatase